MRRTPRTLACIGLALALCAVPSAAPAQQESGLSARAAVEPSKVELGEPVVFRGRVVVPSGVVAKWLPPEPDDALTWSALQPRRVPGRDSRDTLVVEAQIQAFRTGVVPVPGLRVQIGGGREPRIHRLPNVTLVVNSVLTPADSNADLRPVRGPLGAPWWERVAWGWVALGVLVTAAGIVAFMAWRRRRPRLPAPISEVAPDVAAIALAELAALRGLNLPTHGRFAEHAFHLTRILRRFLEATMPLSRPGDTTPELMAHLENQRLTPDDLAILEELLRHWDRVKFALAPSSIEESQRAERAVEQLIRRHAPSPAVAIAKVA